MANQLHLVWDNPHAQAQGRADLSTLRRLADALAGSIRSGQLDCARRLASFYHLSPLALSVVATRMFKAGISEDEILKLV